MSTSPRFPTLNKKEEKPMLHRNQSNEPRQRLFPKETNYLFNRTKTETPSPILTKRSQAKLELYDIYKLKDEKTLESLKKHPHLAYVKSVRKLHYKPEFLNLVTSRESMEKFDISSYEIGDRYAEPLSEALRHLPKLSNLNIRSNRLQSRGMARILQNVHASSMKILDLSHNTPGKRGIRQITNILEKKSCNLTEIQLEKTNLTLEELEMIAIAIKNNYTVEKFSISNNNLRSAAGNSISKILENSSLKSLDISWNNINGEGASAVFEALVENRQLEFLNYSENSLGRDPVFKSASILSRSLQENKELLHLDISNNFLTEEEVQIISEGLNENHTLLGLHIQGNFCKIDTQGFLEPLSRIPQKQLRKLGIKRANKAKFCWICEKWVDFTFVWSPTTVMWNRSLKFFAIQMLDKQEEPVYVHLEMDNWKPCRLLKTIFGHYEITRAVPNKTLRFFFTYRGVAEISNEYEVSPLDEPIQKEMYFYRGFSKEVFAIIVNKSSPNISHLTAEPRPTHLEYEPVIEIEFPDFSEWSIEQSIFKHYMIEVSIIQTNLEECFEFDWSNSKIPRFVKQETVLEEVKEILKKNYRLMEEIDRLQAYKYLCSFNSKTEVFMISLLVLTEFFEKNGFIDNRLFRISDLDVLVKASNFNFDYKQSNYGILRHEFLELLVRVSIDKYKKKGVAENVPDALNLLLNEEVLQEFDSFDKTIWLWNRFFNEECDEILIGNLGEFENLYGKFSGKNSKPGEKKNMCLEEFISLCEFVRVLDKKVNERIAAICFHMSLKLRVDEMSDKKYTEADFYEFVQAFCRVIDLKDEVKPEISVFRPASKVSLAEKVKAFINSRIN